MKKLYTVGSSQPEVFCKKGSLKILLNSQENKVKPATLLKK